MSEHEVTVTRTIHAGSDRVWTTLTDSKLVTQWMMGAAVNSTWQAGAQIRWSGEHEGKRYEDKGEVLEVDHGKRLVHTHFSPLSGGEDKPENYHRLTWRLDADGDTTKLTLVQSGAKSAKEAEQFAQSWRAMLDQLRDVAED